MGTGNVCRLRASVIVLAAVVAALGAAHAGRSAASEAPGDPEYVEALYPSRTDMQSMQELPELTGESAIEDYIVYGELNNPGLRAAYERWQAALEQVPQVTSLPDPRLSYGYFIREVETRVGPMKQKVGVSQSFPWFGTLDLRGSVAAEAANAEKARFDAARLKLAYRVENAYYEYYYLARALEVTRKNMELVASLEEVLETMFRAGETSNANLIKAQVELGKLRDRVRTLEDVKSPVVARLNAALNRPPDTPIPEPDEAPSEYVPLSGNELLQRLVETNPELQAIDFMAAKEKTSIALARKAYYPDFMVGVDYTDVGDAWMPGVGDSGKDAVSAMVSINVPIWHGKYRAAEKGARARYEAAQQDRVDRENALAADLEMALFEYRDAERKIELYGNTLIPRAEQSLEVNRQSFTAGEVGFLDIIDAERMLLEFRLSYERALADRAQRFAEIQMLVGTDVSGSGPGEQTTGEEEENQ